MSLMIQKKLAGERTITIVRRSCRGKSKFQGLFDAAKARQTEESGQPEQKEAEVVPSPQREDALKETQWPRNFEQVTAYIL